MTVRQETMRDTIARWAEEIAEFARREQLDFYETRFELLDADEISQVAAYGGFPQRFPHWRYGMEYERLQRTHRYGLGKIYEMVINNDPCYAYLLNDSHVVDYKTVIAHVYAHCDFFKHNHWFSGTNRRMMDEMANHATRVRRYIDRHGLDRVEPFIDTCLAVEDLIDPHSVFMRRDADRWTRTHPPVESEAPRVTRYPAKQYMEDFINPPSALARERDKKQKEKDAHETRMPAHPMRDVLLFILEHAPLSDWQADILSIIRQESYYFAPQGQTKIMNEGWASYWHSTIMTRYCLREEDLITYCDHHSGTLATSPGRLNPYKMGIELLRDIERRWNTGRHGLEYERCTDMEARRTWKTCEPPEGAVIGRGSPGREKIFEVRRIYNDVTFIDEFLTPEFAEDQKLYHYRMDPATGRVVAVKNEFDKIKQQMLFMLTNHARPYIYVLDGNYRNRGELYLGHRHNGVDLDIKYAVETLKSLQRLWGRPVHLHARIDDDAVLFSFDGQQSTQQRVDDSVPSPACKL
ncbi:MAG: SpoVR family protein [Phycisphaerales bacterium]|nr:SpoVR family protein [Phycisphaerales bacterium]